MDYNHAIERVGEVIDGAGVAVMVAGAVIAAGTAAIQRTRHEAGIYHGFRERLGQTILLGLELLVIGDIVRTIAAAPTFTGVAVLGIIVLIRTFLSFSLQVELTGRWPWRANTPRHYPPLRGIRSGHGSTGASVPSRTRAGHGERCPGLAVKPACRIIRSRR